jgi:hypothetical protein
MPYLRRRHVNDLVTMLICEGRRLAAAGIPSGAKGIANAVGCTEIADAKQAGGVGAVEGVVADVAVGRSR